MLASFALALLLVQAGDPGALVVPSRDPFKGPTEFAESAPCEPRGLHCIRWQDLRVTAIVTGPAGSLATFATGSGESWFGKEGDRVRNAAIVSVDPQRRGVVLREPAPGTVAGFREIVLVTGEAQPIVREPMSAEPALSITR